MAKPTRYRLASLLQQIFGSVPRGPGRDPGAKKLAKAALAAGSDGK
ncbi:MAG: hypothetical protein ACLP5O_09005 [Acidimicrobiales bacterium]|jgi:hypothetical protein